VTVHQAINSITATGWPDFVASAEGFNDREGLDVELDIVPVDAMIGAMLGGSVEIGLPNVTGLALAVDKGATIVAIGVGADNQPYHLMTSPAVKTFADLKGKTIALSDTTDIYTTVMKTILKKNGLNPDTDVEFLFGPGQNQRYAAIVGGAIAGGFFALPADADLESRGYNVLAFAPDYYPHLTLSVVAVNRVWADKNPDVLRRFLRARSNAIKWLNAPENKVRAIQILVAQTKLPVASATAAYDYYVTKGHVFPDDGCVTRPGIDQVVRILHDQGRLGRLTASDGEKLIDRQWCPK
jgi:ABC-type nitrate/sulfonate/bicarbonate transport system substrate-binding protein